MRMRLNADASRAWAAVLLALGLLAATPPGAAADHVGLSPLTIVAGDEEHRFEVELAASAQERARGLMYREELGAKQGMLFDFGREQPVSMWMRNTLIPLDMLFIDADGSIRKIASGTTPMSLETIPSGEPVMAVLELNAGVTRLLGIGPGDRVIHPIFGNEQADPHPDPGSRTGSPSPE